MFRASLSGIGPPLCVALIAMALMIFGPMGCACDQPEMPQLADNWSATVLVRVGGGHGTGVVVSHCGHILTNAHVANAAEGGEIQVIVDGPEAMILDASVVAVDEEHDLAILRVQHAFERVAAIETDDSTFFPGDGCYSIGYPLGFGKLASVGNVRTAHFSASGPGVPPVTRDAMMLEQQMEPGTSGSGIYSTRDGKLVGLMSQILWSGQSVFQLESSPIVVPVRHIRPFLTKNHVPFCREHPVFSGCSVSGS